MAQPRRWAPFLDASLLSSPFFFFSLLNASMTGSKNAITRRCGLATQPADDSRGFANGRATGSRPGASRILRAVTRMILAAVHATM